MKFSKQEIQNSKLKTIHIVRHGKALQSYRSISDYDRPLIEKGIVNNEAVAWQLSSQFTTPDLIISSHAARALHTAHIFARVMDYPQEQVQVNKNLYMDGEDEARDVLKNLPDNIYSVMIVGHNPDMTCLAYTYAKQNIDPLPTSGVVTIRFETDKWSQIESIESFDVQKFVTSV